MTSISVGRGLHGRGVFAGKRFKPYELIEICEVILLPISDKGAIHRFTYAWSSRQKAIALGCGSLYNHSYTPNAYVYQYEDRFGVFAYKAISRCEEIFINYNGDVDDRTPVGFRVKT